MACYRCVSIVSYFNCCLKNFPLPTYLPSPGTDHTATLTLGRKQHYFWYSWLWRIPHCCCWALQTRSPMQSELCNGFAELCPAGILHSWDLHRGLLASCTIYFICCTLKSQLFIIAFSNSQYVPIRCNARFPDSLPATTAFLVERLGFSSRAAWTASPRASQGHSSFPHVCSAERSS